MGIPAARAVAMDVGSKGGDGDVEDPQSQVKGNLLNPQAAMDSMSCAFSAIGKKSHEGEDGYGRSSSNQDGSEWPSSG